MSGANEPKVSIVVPSYNGAATLEACLRALTRQDLAEPYEIILVDDGSTDSTPKIAARYAPCVRLLRQSRKGAAAARNVGTKEARGDVVLFTDADCEPVPGWATALVRAIRDGAAGAKGTYRTRQRSLTARFVQAEYESKYRRMAHRRRIDFIDTYSAAYRRDVLLDAGGFDEQISAVEDQELSFRLAERGFDLRFVPEAVVYHTHAATPHAYLRKKFWIGYWKVRVAALHPERIVTDSHTPASLKAQMVLLALSLPALLLSIKSRLARRGLAASALAFLGSALPFAVSAARTDRGIAAASPLMMLIRAAGLSWGFVVGLTRFGKQLFRRAGYEAIKRTTDVALAAAGLAITAPLIAALAIAIKLDSRGPAFFVQWRVGRDGKPFRMYKLRSMVDGAEALRAELLRSRGLAEPVLKIEGDPRVTRVGRLLRRWSLDELPQLINVLKGDMTLVGPRPEEVQVVEMYSPWHRQRLKVTPGVTGPMQINGRAKLCLDDRVRLEIAYIENPSLAEDLRILAYTARAVISGHGSY